MPDVAIIYYQLRSESSEMHRDVVSEFGHEFASAVVAPSISRDATLRLDRLAIISRVSPARNK